MRTAYLDIDGTLVEDGLWSVLIRQLITEGLGDRLILEDCLDALDDPERSGTAALIKGIPTAFMNLTPSLLAEVTDRAWRHAELLPSTLELADTLREHKVSTVLISGAPQQLADRVGEIFSTGDVHACTIVPGMDHFLTTMESPEAKAELVHRHDGDLRQALAIGNGYNDIGMLSAVGHPIVIEPSDRLREAAAGAGWPVTDRNDLMRCVKDVLDLQ